MTIAIGSDHAGYPLKQHLIQHLSHQGIATNDCGTHSLASCDYPDYAHAVAHEIANGAAQLGILVCGSGQGVAITANKHAHIRAALAWNSEIAGLAKEHNNANVVCLPARFVSEAEAIEIIDTFLATEFAGGRHQNRIEKITL